MRNPGIMIRVECSDCGHVKVAPNDVTIRNCIDTDDWSYRFVCPACGVRSAAATKPAQALAAMCEGAEFETWTLPAEAYERPDGPPLTLVDVLELRLLLIEPDWIEQLL